MSRNGSGTYVLPAGQPVVTGTTINSTTHNTLASDLANALTTSIATDGQSVISANIPFSGFKATGLGAATVAGDALRFEQLFSQGAPVTLASATTTDIGAQNSVAIEITGTTTITSFGTSYNGPRYLRFTGALILTHGASLNLPGAANITTAAGDTAIAYPNSASNGWNVVGYQYALTKPVALVASLRGNAKNLAASATGLSANVTVSADEVVTENSSNDYVTLRAVSLTIAGTSVGANALDAGTIAASTWYSVWVIWNGTTTAGLLSLSATAPTLPTGYTHSARVGWIRTDGTGNKYPLSFIQTGRDVQYKVAGNVANLPIMASGAAGASATPTWVAVATSGFIPSTAAAIVVVGKTNSAIIIAPNNSYGNLASLTNPPPLSINVATSGNTVMGSLIPESANIYWANDTASAVMLCVGWRDNL